MTFAERLSAALARRMDTDKPGLWLARHALKCGISPKTLERYVTADTAPSWEIGMAMCAHFGDEFRTEVEGEASEPSIEQLAERVIETGRQMAKQAKTVSC